MKNPPQYFNLESHIPKFSLDDLPVWSFSDYIEVNWTGEQKNAFPFNVILSAIFCDFEAPRPNAKNSQS